MKKLPTDPTLVPLYKDLESLRVIIFFLCATLMVVAVILTLRDLIA